MHRIHYVFDNEAEIEI